jgi:polyferredoxin
MSVQQRPNQVTPLPIPQMPLAPDTTPEPRGRNLLEIPWVRRIAESPLYPKAFQWAVLAGFTLVGYQLLVGPETASENLGTVLMWVIWWPLIPVAFLLLGRFWCAICPFATINDLVQKLVGLERPVPPFLKKYGIWIIDASFLAITWADHMWGVVESPWGSGVLVLLLTTAVVVSGALWQRRAFCRYLCFLGGVSSNYSRTGIVSLRANEEICKTCTSRAVCYNGSAAIPGCPLFSFPRKLDSNAECNLCANCIKNCPNGSISVSVRKPTSELWFMSKPQIEVAFLAMAIMGIVVYQNVSMLDGWPTVLRQVGAFLRTDYYPVVFSFTFAVAIAMQVGLLAAVSAVASRFNTETLWENSARFGYALIPLDIAAHTAHNLFHLLSEGKAVIYTALPIVGQPMPTASPAIVGSTGIQLLQFALLALGVLASLYAVYRTAKRQYPTTSVYRRVVVPFAVLVITLGIMNTWMFTLPMMHRV